MVLSSSRDSASKISDRFSTLKQASSASPEFARSPTAKPRTSRVAWSRSGVSHAFRTPPAKRSSVKCPCSGRRALRSLPCRVHSVRLGDLPRRPVARRELQHHLRLQLGRVPPSRHDHLLRACQVLPRAASPGGQLRNSGVFKIPGSYPQAEYCARIPGDERWETAWGAVCVRSSASLLPLSVDQPSKRALLALSLLTVVPFSCENLPAVAERLVSIGKDRMRNYSPGRNVKWITPPSTHPPPRRPSQKTPPHPPPTSPDTTPALPRAPAARQTRPRWPPPAYSPADPTAPG